MGDSVPLSLRQAIRDDIEEEDDQVITMATTVCYHNNHRLIPNPFCILLNSLTTK